MATTTIFEHKTCGRCGGSGQYSWNAMHGSRCYGCNGTGWTYTKRGAAASKKLQELLSKPAGELKPGDKIQFSDPLRGTFWLELETVTPNDHGTIDVRGTFRGESTGWHGLKPDKLMRVACTAEQKNAARAEALAYQDSLTQSGTPRKRK